MEGQETKNKTQNIADLKERGSSGLPNWLLYYKACAMVWIKEWITLENQRLLKLESHDLKWVGMHMSDMGNAKNNHILQNIF